MKRRFSLIALILVFLLTGFLRESFFYEINSLIDYKSQDEGFQLTGKWSFLNVFSPSSLILVKWVATFVFIVVFFSLTFFLVKLIFPETNNSYIVIVAYTGLVLLALLAMLLGKLFPSAYSSFYYFSRWLSGSAQSPLLPSIICIAIYFSSLKKR